jgi:hypothetical protein
VRLCAAANALWTLAGLCCVPSAFAQSGTAVSEPSARIALAETLYHEGRRLMAEQSYGEAAAKFAESHRLDPATGTLLNLATCHARDGRLATAWLEFNVALRRAQQSGQHDRVDFVRLQLSQIEPRLSRLTIEVTPEAEVGGLEVSLDGVLLGRAGHGVPMPIDGGRHRLTAKAPGRVPWSIELDIRTELDSRTIVIPPLKPSVVVPALPAEQAAPALPTRPSAGSTPERNRNPVPLAVYVGTGVTAAWLGAALVTGALYLDAASDSNGDQADESAEQAAYDRAERWQHINTGLFVLAGLSAGVTVYLYATRETDREVSQHAWLTTGFGRLTAGARF